MAMSCEAEKNAKAAAAAITRPGATAASENAIAKHASAINGWINNNHPRRRPSQSRWSSKGAHKNFKLYARPIFAVSPIAANETDPSDNHCRKVNPDSDNGSPAKNPNPAMNNRRRSFRKRGKAIGGRVRKQGQGAALDPQGDRSPLDPIA